MLKTFLGPYEFDDVFDIFHTYPFQKMLLRNLLMIEYDFVRWSRNDINFHFWPKESNEFKSSQYK